MINELKYLIETDTDLSSISFNNYHGIKFNKLRKIAKKIALEKRYDFFLEKHTCFEEKIIHAYAIGYVKEDISFQINLVKDFIKQIDNWSICDALCQNMQFAKTNQEDVFDYLISMKESTNQWEVRIIAVTLLSHYLNDNYVDKVLEILDCLNDIDYIAQMAIAWALATIMAKYPEKTFEFLKNTNISKITYNKAISKMLESYRVKKEDKNILRRYRK